MNTHNSLDTRLLKWGAATIGAFMVAVFAVNLAHAEAPEGHRKPPQAAFDACKDKQAAAACQVTFGERTIDGTCNQTPDGLACRPNHRHGPPPALFDACKDKQENDACKATLGEHAVDGHCRQSRHGDRLICSDRP